jgi:hypothetical protein
MVEWSVMSRHRLEVSNSSNDMKHCLLLLLVELLVMMIEGAEDVEFLT